MERNLVVSVPETDISQPYLEAKLYMDRVEQEEYECRKDECNRTPDPESSCVPEPLEHGVSHMMCPVRVHSQNLSFATVLWDMPQIPTEDSSLETDTVGDLTPNWVVNPMEEIIKLVPEDVSEQTNVELQKGSSHHFEPVINSCQVCIT